MRTLSNEGIQLIQHFESCRLKTYLCSAGKLTIGWGHTGADVKPKMVITQARADELFRIDVSRFVKDVNFLVKADITQKQFDALVSFAFNVGSDIDKDTIAEGLGDSTLLRLVNAGSFSKAADEFPKWNKQTVNGKKVVVLGLSKRRAAERSLFSGASVEGALRIAESIR
ncbi:lysozyme [Polynucleobacter sp.]|uniref:lysozyme n=1 Tax=Polynucleobacter sp. TaxID=2029855 RepID=UPI003F6A179A